MNVWTKRLTGLLAAMMILGLATTAQAQTKKLLADIDAITTDFRTATDSFWEATEILQTTVFAYVKGDVPILTKNWEAVKTIRDNTNKKMRKQFKPLRGDYLKEMETRAKFFDSLIGDPAKTLDIKGQFTTEDIDKLKKLPTLLKNVVDLDTKAVKRAIDIAPQIPGAVTEIGSAIAKNPLKAGAYKKQIKKLKRGGKKLKALGPEGTRQIKAAGAMTSSVTRLLKKDDAPKGETEEPKEETR